MKCRKTKTREITTTNQKKGNIASSQWGLKAQYVNCLKRGKMRVAKSQILQKIHQRYVTRKVESSIITIVVWLQLLFVRCPVWWRTGHLRLVWFRGEAGLVVVNLVCASTSLQDNVLNIWVCVCITTRIDFTLFWRVKLRELWTRCFDSDGSVVCCRKTIFNVNWRVAGAKSLVCFPRDFPVFKFCIWFIDDFQNKLWSVCDFSPIVLFIFVAFHSPVPVPWNAKSFPRGDRPSNKGTEYAFSW